MTDRIYLAALSWNDAIGPKRFFNILNECPSLQDYFQLDINDRLRIAGVKGDKQRDLFEKMDEEGERIVRICERDQIKMIAINDPDYPPKLKMIPDPPPVIYVRGQINYSMPMIAIVGTRRYTPEGENINHFFSRELVEYNIGIVSGLAIGHDSIAQRTVIDNNGYTIAVLGSGIDVIYPPENRKLYHDIVETGAVVSEYPPEVQPDRWRFPLRNRIISGLSDGVLLIEAPERSGALITCKYAREQDKEVFAVPGSPLAPSFNGNNSLIMNGVVMVMKPEDIVQHLLGSHFEKKRIPHEQLQSITESEKKVYDVLEQEMHVDAIASECNIPIPELFSVLTQLEIKGIITQLPGNFYIRNVL